MDRLKNIIFFALVFVLSIGGFCQTTKIIPIEYAAENNETKIKFEKRKSNRKNRRAELTGKLAPSLSLLDHQGRKHSWEKYKGKYVFIDFWATFCGPCVAYIPELVEAYSFTDKNKVEFVSICLDLEGAKLTKYAKTKKMNWSQFGTTQGWYSKVADQFGITKLPQYFILSPEGKILDYEEQNSVFNEISRHLLGRTKKRTKTIGEEMIIAPGDLHKAELREEGEQIYVYIVFTNEKLKELIAWSEENFGKTAKMSAGGKTIFNGKIQMKMDVPSFLMSFQTKQEAEAFCKYMMEKR